VTPPWGSRRRWPPVSVEPGPETPAGGFKEHTLTLPVTAASVTLARRTAQMAFTAFGLAPSASLLDAALLITTELVANSVRHANASPHLDLTLGLNSHELTIACHDQDPTLPPWPPTSRYGAARRGLAVLADLVAGHAGRIDLQPDRAAPGKTIRVVLPRTP
jgi:hypothetical protein